MKATRVIRDTNLLPEETVRAATELAYQFAPDAPLRALSSQILGNCSNVPQDGPTRIAEWVKQHVKYRQEAPGIEVLQGPYTTIPAGVSVGSFHFDGTGVGDCDDLAILWATLCRASGIEACVAALGPFPYLNTGFVHALGYCFSNGKFYELSDDEQYGGVKGKPLVLDGPPVGYSAYCWSPQQRGFVVITNDPNAPAKSYSMGGMGMYDQSRMKGTMAASSGISFGKVPPDVAVGQAQSGARSPRLSEFDGSLPLDTSKEVRPDDPNFIEAFETAFHGANSWFNSNFGVDISAEFGLTPRQAMSALQQGIVDIGSEVAGAEGQRNTAMLLSGVTGFLTSPTPVTAALGVIVGLGVLVKGLMHQGKYKRRYTRLDDNIKSYADQICGLALPPGYERTESGLLQMCSMKTRMMEIIPILQGEAGRSRNGFRSQVRVPLTANQYVRDGGYAMFKRGGFSRDARIALTRKAQEWGHGRFLDGTTNVKGMEYVGGTNNRGTAKSMAICRDGYRLTHELVRAISVGATQNDGPARRDLAAAMFWSLLAQIMRIRFNGQPPTTIAQRRVNVRSGRGIRTVFTGGQHDPRQIVQASSGALDNQKVVFIDYNRFWQGVNENGVALPAGAFNRVWGKTIVDMVRPAERAFGAVEGTFDDGGILEQLRALGLPNYLALNEGFEAGQGRVSITEDPSGGSEEGGGGGALALGLGLGAGALALLLGGG